MLKHIFFAAVLFVVALGHTADAAVVNVDFKENPGEATHTGANGIFSSAGGTTWNGVVAAGPASNLDDEFGVTTGVGIVPVDMFSFTSTTGNNDNELQNSGVQSGFFITNLLAGESYNLAFYLAENSGIFDLVDLGGPNQVGNGAHAPTYTLPGSAGQDHFQINGLVPFDIGSGVLGLQVDGLDGTLLGVQIDGNVPEPSALALLGFGGLAVFFRRRSA